MLLVLDGCLINMFLIGVCHFPFFFPRRHMVQADTASSNLRKSAWMHVRPSDQNLKHCFSSLFFKQSFSLLNSLQIVLCCFGPNKRYWFGYFYGSMWLHAKLINDTL